MENSRNEVNFESWDTEIHNKTEHGDKQDDNINKLDNKYKIIATLMICFCGFVYVSIGCNHLLIKLLNKYLLI